MQVFQKNRYLWNFEFFWKKVGKSRSVDWRFWLTRTYLHHLRSWNYLCTLPYPSPILPESFKVIATVLFQISLKHAGQSEKLRTSEILWFFWKKVGKFRSVDWWLCLTRTYLDAHIYRAGRHGPQQAVHQVWGSRVYDFPSYRSSMTGKMSKNLWRLLQLDDLLCLTCTTYGPEIHCAPCPTLARSILKVARSLLQDFSRYH